MRPEAKLVCGSCPHQGVLHVLPVGACQVNGCRCSRFTDPTTAAPEADEDRTLVVRIPAGYFATVSVYPFSGGDDDGS